MSEQSAPGGSGRRAIIIMFAVGGGVALLAILGTFLASRGGSSTAPADLNGTTWTTSAMTVNGTEQPLAAGSTLTMTFADGRVSTKAGCNQQNGDATWTGGQLIMTGPMASTMMACEQALMDQDQTIAAFLSGNPSITQQGESIVLSDGSMSMTLTRSA